MASKENEPDHEWAQRHAVTVAEAAISPDDTNLARAYIKLAARLKETEGFCENLRPLARRGDFYRKLLVEKCGEAFVQSEENEEEFLHALYLEAMKEDARRWYRKVN